MESQDNGTKGIRIFASPEKQEHQTIFGVKPVAPAEERQDPPDLEDLGLLSSKQSDDNLNQISNWELLNLEDEESKTTEVPEEAPEEPHEISQEKPQNPEDEITAAPVMVPPPPASSAIADTSADFAKNTDNSPVTSSAPADLTNIGQNASLVGIPPTQAPSFLACMPPYGMPQYYMPAAGISPLFGSQWNGNPMAAQVYPGVELTSIQTPSQSIPSAPLVPQQSAGPISSTAELVAVPLSSVSVSQQPKEQPDVPKTEHRKKDKPSKSHYMPLCLQTLRSMGYTQDERTLKRIIRSKKGNLNEILDSLNNEFANFQ